MGHTVINQDLNVSISPAPDEGTRFDLLESIGEIIDASRHSYPVKQRQDCPD
jgi:hypothetical protein